MLIENLATQLSLGNKQCTESVNNAYKILMVKRFDKNQNILEIIIAIRVIKITILTKIRMMKLIYYLALCNYYKINVIAVGNLDTNH